MTPQQQEQALKYKEEFENSDTTDERRVEILTWLQERAVEDGEPNQCMNCQKTVFFAEAEKGLIEGHIYSRDGAREYQISWCCEFCFDKLFKEEDEDEENVDE